MVSTRFKPATASPPTAPTARSRSSTGPRRFFAPGVRLEALQRFTAGPAEYLAIRRLDGTTTHVAGPATAWLDPLTDEEIVACPLITVDANEALVAYRLAADGAIARRILRGPTRHLPAPDGWLHDFRWHGADPRNPRHKVPRALCFTKLRVIPDQMYFDVEDARTADDALLTVQTMVFFELVDIERMLDRTHDPVADFINALTADVIDFAAARVFERFKADTAALNELATYPNLLARAEAIGYRIHKVVYRGYEANPRLQAMHDQAIERRTGLQLEAETEAQAQELADLKAEREALRERGVWLQEQAEAEHHLGIARAREAERLRREADAHEQAMAFKKDVNRLEVEHRAAVNAEELAARGGLRELGVDLTRYLVAQHEHPDRWIRVDGTEAVHVQT